MTFINDPVNSVSVSSASPIFDYSSRDYTSIYTDLTDRIPLYLPEWTSRSNNDFGIALLQMFAYVGDLLGYYLDRLAGEAFIFTATQPQSIVNLANMLDYQPTLSGGAVAALQITVASSIVGPITIPAGSQFQTMSSSSQPSLVFETDDDLVIAGANAATPSTVGTVLATQGITQSLEVVGASDGSINQSFSLKFGPVSAGSFHVFVDLGLGPVEWTYVQTLINSGSFDQVFTNFVDANGVFYVIFGDGVNGYVPPLGSPVTVTYQVNAGSIGNVGAGTITSTVQAVVGVVGVTNVTAASGGTGAQTLDSIRQAAPASLRALNRGVTTIDIATLAFQVSGVEWANAVEVTYQLVNLYIAPFGGGAPTAVLQDAVLTYINPLLMANTAVTILAPTYVPINITANLFVYENFGNSATTALTTAALTEFLTLPNTGFGFRVSLGYVYQIILSQLGVNWAIVTGLNRQVLCTLITALTSGQSYSQLEVTPLPQSVGVGDSILITGAGTGTTQVLTALTPGNPGDAVINVAPFTANGTYAIGVPVQDTSGVNDCVLLPNEIPIVGSISLVPADGILGS